MKQQTIDLILKESFKLFAGSRYEHVTVADIERATKLTRGAIFYYMANKEHLFKEIADKYIFNQELTSKGNKQNLASFIDSFIGQLKDLKKQMKSLGVKNANYAYINIINQATHYYPDYIKESKKNEKKELNIWIEVVQNAISSGEIVKDTNSTAIGSIFYHLYAGFSYKSIFLPDGIDIDQLQKTFDTVYQMIKK
ncbi:MAG: TetR/AcrR family transcriptional regulator [Tannerella sp.]|jgi:hypothetical protein|nr:TetR/AcrR family transcriptional regulator [Tannerella sp.]